MGISNTKTIRILVIGLTNSGKTHFLDMFHFGSDSTKLPTFGYYETVVEFENYEFILTEYGGMMEWDKMLEMKQEHPFHCIYMMIDGQSSPEVISESNNALLMMSQHVKKIPIAILWNNSEKVLKLQHRPRDRAICTCYLNYHNNNWKERVTKLFEWTIQNV